MEFTDIIKQIMYEKKLKQADLCRLANIPSSLMSEYVKGKKSPAISNAINIADALDITLDQLVGRTPIEVNKSYETKNVFTLASSNEIDHIKKYRALDERGQQTVDTVLNNLYEIAISQKETSSLDMATEELAQYTPTRKEMHRFVDEQYDEFQKGTKSGTSSSTSSLEKSKIG